MAFADGARLEAIVKQAAAQFPKVNLAEFRKFVSDRARTVQIIASYLSAYVDFSSDLAADRIEELASNTLAFHLSDQETRAKLLEVFKLIAASIEKNSDEDFRKIIRRSPLSAADIYALRDWAAKNHSELVSAAASDSITSMISEKALSFCASSSIKNISDQTLIMPSLEKWLSGESFENIRAPMTKADARVGRAKISVEHTVALCEGGFGYDLSMIVSTASDLFESIDENLRSKTSLLHKRMKYGLPDVGSIAFFEAGFSDRLVAQALSINFEEIMDRASVRRLCRERLDQILGMLSSYPSYFSAIANELGRQPNNFCMI